MTRAMLAFLLAAPAAARVRPGRVECDAKGRR